MYYPSKTEFKKLAKTHNLIPVYREVVADVETPVSAFLKLGRGKNAFLLESVEGGERLGRYSFIGVSPYLVVTSLNGNVEVKGVLSKKFKGVNDPLKIVEETLAAYKFVSVGDLPPFVGGAVGYVGYDAVRYFEKIPRTGIDDLELPEMVFVFTDTILIFDHLKHKIKVVANAFVEKGKAEQAYRQAMRKVDNLVNRLQKPVLLYSRKPAKRRTREVRSNVSRAKFTKMVEAAKDYIKAGDILQVVLSQRFTTEIAAEPFDVYRALRILNPSPYMYYLKYQDLELIGSSPEPLVKVEGSKVITRPIAGTRRRGRTPQDEVKMERELTSSRKEKAEHIMLVDLGRNDLGRVCSKGSVKVDDLMFVEKYSHVMHLVSQVSGKLLPSKNAFDVLRAAFPAGTVSGAPKIRAMEIIDELEPTLRGPYAGVVGYCSYSGSLDTCITIRTIVIKGKKAYIQAGAGIVYDSKPALEYKETQNKAQALLKAIKVAEEGLT